MDILDPIPITINYWQNIASDAFDKTFPPEGVDPIDNTLNGNDEEFESDDGISYRNHNLTRISSFIGLPNRKLYKSKGQSWQNLWDNFLAKQDNISKKRSISRAIIMVPLNVISIPFKLVRNILKFGMEFILLACSNILWDLGVTILNKAVDFPHSHFKLPILISRPIAILIYLSALLLFGIRWPLIGIYLTNRCLLDPYDSLCSAWKYGINSPFGKPLAYFLSGLSIFTTLIMFCFALPIAAKLFAISIGPPIMHYLPTVIDNAFIKIAHALTPVLSAIGKRVAVITDVAIGITNLPLAFAMHVLIHMPALVGGSLFFATGIATIGLVANKYINKFKAWWNYDPNFTKPTQGEGATSKELDQQFNMILALGEKNLSKTRAAATPVLPVMPVVNNPSSPAVSVNALNGAAISVTVDSLPTASLRTQISSSSTNAPLPSAASKIQNHEEDEPEKEKRSNMSLEK